MGFELSSNRKLDVGNLKRIVVRGTNWIGDAVLTFPALRELRRILPDAHITLATRSSTKALFAEADFIDDILVYDRGSRDMGAVIRQTREWRTRKFDMAVLLQNAFEAALIAFLGGVYARVGYTTDARGLLLTHPLAVPAWRGEKHEVFYYLNIVTELEKRLYPNSVVLNGEPVFDLTVSNARQNEARDLLHAIGARANRQLVALCPGSTNSRAKRWPAERFAALADKIVAEAGADVVLIGSKAETEVSDEVAKLMQSKPVMLTGRTELAQAVAVLSLTDVLVTNDTGPAHIGAALGRPTLVIFGPTDPVTTRPFSTSSEVIRHPPDCAPCMLRDCPIDHRCMTAITPDEVFTRVSALLGQRRTGVQV